MEMHIKNAQRGFSTTAIVAIIALIVLVIGAIYAGTAKETRPASVAGTHESGMETSATDSEMMGAGVLFKNGTIMLQDEKGMQSPLTTDYVFSDGTKVSLSGKVTKTDGTTTQLKEGESVWLGGMIIKAGEMMKGDESMESDSKTMGYAKAGVYEPYDQKLLANAATGKVILFFHAAWCPTCHALDADIRAHLDDIPPGVTILETDYDQETALKQKYAVTVQGTFVQVDQNGNKLNKWGDNDTFTLADLLSKGGIK